MLVLTVSITDDSPEFASLADGTDDYVDAEEQDEEPIGAMIRKEHRESIRSRGSRLVINRASVAPDGSEVMIWDT